MKEIKLTRNQKTILDDADHELFGKFTWHCSSNGYAARRIDKGPMMLLHREILEAPKNMEVDHVNSNRLDNRRCNLRLATQAQNQANRRKTCGNTKYKGVHFSKSELKYKAYITHNNKRYALGTFGSAVCAALAYDKAARNFKGVFAKINFPGIVQ